MIEITIVIPTLNSSKFIGSCLNSIFAQGFRDFETIVIDNGSKDGCVNFIKNNYPPIILIENKQNLGACKARNQGIERAQGKWILSLDCDVVLASNFLSEIHKIAKELPANVGIIQPKILKTDKITIYSCGIYLTWMRRFYDIGSGEPDSVKFGQDRGIFGACCAAALYRKSMLEELKESTGYFDERFFFLVEDVDLSWRAKRKDWKAYFYPHAICYHHGNSSNYLNKERKHLCFRNRFYAIKKNEGLIAYSAKIFPLLVYDFPRAIYLLIKSVKVY